MILVKLFTFKILMCSAKYGLVISSGKKNLLSRHITCPDINTNY